MNNNVKGEKSVLVDQDQLAKNSIEDKLRDRTISEGYKYKTLDESLSSDGFHTGDTVKPKADWSKRYCRLACLLAVCIFVIAFLVAIVIYQHVSSDDKKDVCTSPGCIHASSYILGNMDVSYEPCDDFYQFICGNWENTVKIPASRAKYNTFSVVSDENRDRIKKLLESNATTVNGQHSKTVEKMKTFYKMCLDQKTVEQLGVKPLQQLIKDLGSWTVTDSGWDEGSWSMVHVLGKIHLHDVSPLFDCGLTIDDKNHSSYIFTFSQPELTLQAREEYNTSYPNYTEFRRAFLDFGATVGQFLGGDYDEVRLKMEDIYKLEQELAAIKVPKEILRQPELRYHRMTFKDLKKLFGDWIDLDVFIRQFMKFDFTDSTKVLVHTPDYIRQLGSIVSKTDKRTLANYMMWTVVNGMLGSLPVKVTESVLILEQVESGVKVLDPIEQRCVDKTNSVFGFATGALYVEKYFPESSKKTIEDILDRVIHAFASELPNVAWMDDVTQQRALNKLDGFLPMIGYPDWILNVTRLDKYYENITVIPDQLFNSYVNHEKEEVKRALNKYGSVPDRKEWDMDPFTVNAYYAAARNSIVFPAGILQKPFYDPGFPMAYSFGSAGAVMGHEMTHGFDDGGRLYNKHGDLEHWWTNQSNAAFNQKTKCMIDQYSEFTYQGFHNMGHRTIGENMADNGGVKIGYTALQKWLPTSHDKRLPGLDFTPEQLYFIGFGQIWCSHYTHAYAKSSALTDEHSASPLRANGIAMNSPGFAKAFNCPKGSPMNPDHKCSVW